MRYMTILSTAMMAAMCSMCWSSRCWAETPPAAPVIIEGGPAATGDCLYLSLEEAKARALETDSMQIVHLQVREKLFARRAAQADYFPKVIGSYLYLHFDDDLGTVLTTPSIGPIAGRNVAVNLLNQDSDFTTIGVVQPITDLLKVHQAVEIAKADEGIAQAGAESARRSLLEGVEKLYYGLTGAQLQLAAADAKTQAAKAQFDAQPSPVTHAAYLHARQESVAASKQVAELTEQFNSILGLPLCVKLVLLDLPPLSEYVPCLEEAIGMACGCHPEIRTAEMNLAKARAGWKLAGLDYVPSVAVIGGYQNQNSIPAVQEDYSAIGVMANVTILEFGKRRNTVYERDTLVMQAVKALRLTHQKVELDVRNAYRDLEEARENLEIAKELLEVANQAVELAPPVQKQEAVVAQQQAAGGVTAAELQYRTAYAHLMSLIGQP